MIDRLVLVRHGETVGNSSIRYYGRTDIELSELGRAQMRAARRWLQSRFGSTAFTTVVSSPLRRAVEGAAIITNAEPSSQRPVAQGAAIIGADHSIFQIKEFVEVDFGRFEGLTADEIRTRFPADFERWNRDRLDPGFTYPDGESRAEFALRVDRGIQRMLQVIDGTAAQGSSHPMPSDDEVPHGRMRYEDGRISSSAVVREERGAVRGGGVALVVAHRGVIRLIAKRLAGVEPMIELGSIQILQRDRIGDSWRIELIDVLEHLSKLE